MGHGADSPAIKPAARSTPRSLSRRACLLNGLGIAAAASGCSTGLRAALADDPRKTAEGQVRMRSTLDGSAAFWSYSGTVYAIRPAQQPLPILAVSGCQTQWAERLASGAYQVAGMLLTWFQDAGTGGFIEAWSNPFTGQRNPVGVNRFSGGSVIYPADGSSARLEGGLAASESAPQGFSDDAAARPLGRVQWSLTSDKVLLRTDRAFNVRVQPQTEAQTLFADRAFFFDPAVLRLPATYAASTITPWLRWMDMADVPGHLMWHTSGEKLFSIDQLPADYRAKAGSAVDELTARPKALRRPGSDAA